MCRPVSHDKIRANAYEVRYVWPMDMLLEIHLLMDMLDEMEQVHSKIRQESS